MAWWRLSASYEDLESVSPLKQCVWIKISLLATSSKKSQLGGPTSLTPSLPLRPGTPAVSSPSTMSFDPCAAVNAVDPPHDRPRSHRHPERRPTICHRGPADPRRQRAQYPPPTQLTVSCPHHPSQGPLALTNAAAVARRGSLTGTKWTATYPP